MIVHLILLRLLSFFKGWWLSGGYAIEIHSQRNWKHADIDIFALKSSFVGRFKKIFSRLIDVHIIEKKEERYYEKTKGGIFVFSHNAFQKKREKLYGINLPVVTPELLYAFAAGSPNKRKKEEFVLKNFSSKQNILLYRKKEVI